METTDPRDEEEWFDVQARLITLLTCGYGILSLTTYIWIRINAQSKIASLTPTPPTPLSSWLPLSLPLLLIILVDATALFTATLAPIAALTPSSPSWAWLPHTVLPRLIVVLTAGSMGAATAALPFAHVQSESERQDGRGLLEAGVVMCFVAAGGGGTAYMAAKGGSTEVTFGAWVDAAGTMWSLAGASLMLFSLSRGLWMEMTTSCASISRDVSPTPADTLVATQMEIDALELKIQVASSRGHPVGPMVNSLAELRSTLPPPRDMGVWSRSARVGKAVVNLGAAGLVLGLATAYVLQLSLFLTDPTGEDEEEQSIRMAPPSAADDVLPGVVIAGLLVYTSFASWKGAKSLPGVSYLLSSALAPQAPAREEIDLSLARHHYRAAADVFQGAYLKDLVARAYILLLLSSASAHVPSMLGLGDHPHTPPSILSSASTAWIIASLFLLSIIPNAAASIRLWCERSERPGERSEPRVLPCET